MNAKYTMTLEDVLKSGYKLQSLEKYPIYSEKARQDLNIFIINSFSHYEIGFETIEMFDSRLYARMLNIMYKYDYLLELYNTIKEKTITSLFENRFDSYENSKNVYIGTSAKSGNDDFKHGHIIDYTQNLVSDTTTTYNSDNKTIFGSNESQKYFSDNTTFYNSSTITDDDRIITEKTNQLGGKNISESANLTADTPQNNSPISTTSGDFDSFNNSVFQIDGYISKAEKNLNINERHDKTENITNVDGNLNVSKNGNDKLSKNGHDDLVKSGEDNLQHRGNDNQNKNDTGTTLTKNQGIDSTIYNNQQNDKNNTDFTNHKNGNLDYIKTIDDIQKAILNIYDMIAKDLKCVFLEVF